MINQQYQSILSFLVFLMVFSSCEEVIDIDLNSSNPSLVADGTIEPYEFARVNLSYTNDYFNQEDPTFETQADIKLTDSKGNEETLIHQSNGLYVGQYIRGEVEQSYTLQIKLNDKTYEGSSMLMTPTKIIKLLQVESGRPHQGSGKTKYGLEMHLQNNPEEDNYYLIKFFKNGAFQEERYNVIPQDIFPQDEVITYTPMLPSFEVGDRVTVKAYSIDESTYTYYSQLSEITSERPGGSTPYNPASNLGSNIMGYFRAWSVDSKNITIQVME